MPCAHSLLIVASTGTGSVEGSHLNGVPDNLSIVASADTGSVEGSHLHGVPDSLSIVVSGGGLSVTHRARIAF